MHESVQISGQTQPALLSVKLKRDSCSEMPVDQAHTSTLSTHPSASSALNCHRKRPSGICSGGNGGIAASAKAARGDDATLGNGRSKGLAASCMGEGLGQLVPCS